MNAASMKSRILKSWKSAALALGLVAASASAFSLLGPPTSWQVNGLSYQWGEDIGGPMNLGEGFRWNVPVITYACDSTFIDYFGPEGVHAIDQAMQVFNDLPASSKISDDLSEYSVNTLRENFEAETLGIVDLKSTAMHIIMEELGFADPIRFTFTLRARQTRTVGGVTITNYTTVLRNYDPQTLSPSRYVNGVLYTYDIEEFMAPPFDHADAIEFVRSTGEFENIPVATGLGHAFGNDGPNTTFVPGLFRTGLTRDDVGGIKYLYSPHNYAVESLLPGIISGGGGSPWAPFVGVTNAISVTNVIIGGTGTNIVTTGLRAGRNKLKFQRAFFDPVLGTFFKTINSPYTDVVVSSNRTLVVQPVTRVITRPDIVFSAGDLGLAQNIDPLIYTRTSTATWIDNDALNGSDPVTFDHGPGVIAPPIVITFTTLLPIFFNSSVSAFLDEFPSEDTAFTFGVWGSFDGSTNAPIIYPRGGNLSISQLRRQLLSGGIFGQ